ncbi:protein-glutamine gamma-glutamyltransferase 2-like [Toxotes jaculatrix]|uniref:protein-glutamine gamma-glutamyltransferase 2-like n=1 Tax=Toxotes jaculatrix TaxID=941984 RepID=UPI001B3AF752|nr:protein-glutamine gamma-glutamyltransferase 2-like [Toxotes jaculatrix]
MATMMRSVDFHCQSNNTDHRTIEITEKQLIVRRGQSFLLTLNMTQPFGDCDMLVLTVETGSFPSETCGTRSQFGNPSPMYASDVKAIWKYSMDRRADLSRGVVTLSVTPPADAPVGKYSLSAQTRMGKTILGTLVVLFNPWCSDDWVYLPHEGERQEYVMNEQGLIYVGTSDFPCPRDWVFGQFEEDMVDICLKILDVNPKHMKDPADDVSARCNPIYVSRVISAMINCCDDLGVLSGGWDGNYGDGENPSSWLGSVRILRRWFKTNCHPVKYGQCWVFAGVMCTVMRFFGIPCRVVTNFKSAHDTNNNLSIDEYYGVRGAQPKEGRDSVWNFHVWVEGWMKRPDLEKAELYDGWQVLDPTPQEKSEGQFCCGPAPVSAVLQGDTNLKYDVPFVFAEVNADVVKWMVWADGSKMKMSSDTTTVGQNISTKAVGYNLRNDITDSYKYREGSAQEREVYSRAVRRVNSGDGQAADGGKEPLKVQMKIEKDSGVQSGQDINLKLRLCNRDYSNKTMSIYVNAQGMRYNGVPACHILNSVQEKLLLVAREVIIPVQIPFMAYSHHMVNCDSMRVSVVAVDKQKQSDIYESEIDVSLPQPPITMRVVGEARLFQPMMMEVKFTNTLSVALTNCSLTVTGSGMYKFERVESIVRELPPNKTLKVQITTVPHKLGPRVVVADFDCSAFRDVMGSCIVDVRP